MEKFDSTMDNQQSMRSFTCWVLFSQALGLTAVILVGVWMGVYGGGYAWSDVPAKEFNYHPLFMVIGLVFLYGDAILVYRVFRNDRKVYIKIVHATLLFFSLIFAVVGLKAVFDSHNLAKPPIGNMGSLHSWIGIAVVVLFALQWLFGFVSFLFPGVRMDLRGAYKPVHVFWGMTIFYGSIATCLLGILEKIMFASNGVHGLTPLKLMGHALGFVLIALGIVVGYILTRTEFARNPNPEEDHIQLTD